MEGPLVRLERFGAVHGMTVAVAAALVLLLVLLGRRLLARRPTGELWLRRTLAGATLAFVAAALTWLHWPGVFDVRYALPLHLCDLSVVIAPLALLSGARVWRTLLHFWGALSLAAFVYPLATAGPARLDYWVFWLEHLLILAAVAYEVAVRGYRPRGRDVLATLAATAVYTVVVASFDVAFGVDYGFVGPESEITTFLGPWPARVAVLYLLEALGFVLLWLPWRAARGR